MKALYARVKCLIYELNKLIPAPATYDQEVLVKRQLSWQFASPPFISLYKKLFDSCQYKDVIC